MTSKRDLFLNLHEGRPSNTANDICLPITNSRDVGFQGRCFKDVDYVSDLKINLLSMHQLHFSGKKVEFMHDKIFIKDAKDDYRVIAKGVTNKDSLSSCLKDSSMIAEGEVGCHGFFRRRGPSCGTCIWDTLTLDHFTSCVRKIWWKACMCLLNLLMVFARGVLLESTMANCL